jgi:hypothetical protein
MLSPMTADPEIQPMIRPPRRLTGRQGSASRLALFFDLAYVLVGSEQGRGRRVLDRRCGGGGGARARDPP